MFLNLGGILDVTVFRDSVARFTGSPGPILEQHCYPSSLKYDIVVLTKDGYLTATQLGIQRRLGLLKLEFFWSLFFHIIAWCINQTTIIFNSLKHKMYVNLQFLFKNIYFQGIS